MTETKNTQAGSWTDALAKFQASCPPIVKDKSANVGKFGYSYAGLDTVLAIIREPLAKVGLTISQVPILSGETWVLETRLLFRGEVCQVSHWPLSPAMGEQQRGSQITYGRRYSLCAMLGIQPQNEDDDGASATETHAQNRTYRAKQAAEEAKERDRLIGAILDTCNEHPESLSPDGLKALCQQLWGGRQPGSLDKWEDWPTGALRTMAGFLSKQVGGETVG